jgi:excisionase family DNA binding protein
MMITPLQRLKQALEAHRQALAKLEAALTEFEGTLAGEASEQPDAFASELLSMEEVRQTLGMGKSWTYRRVKSGEIPSVKLGRSIKVRREDLEGYLETQRYRPTTFSGLVD